VERALAISRGEGTWAVHQTGGLVALDLWTAFPFTPLIRDQLASKGIATREAIWSVARKHLISAIESRQVGAMVCVNCSADQAVAHCN
jgi:hypothetical protein